MAGPPPATWAAITLDCHEPRREAEFWGALLGLPARSIDLPGWFRLGPAVTGGPVLTFQPVPEPRTGKARVHLDLWVDDLEAAMELVERLGGTAAGERHDYEEGTVQIMRDPESNEFCLVGGPLARR